MKILKTFDFLEKLKIDPITISDLDNIKVVNKEYLDKLYKVIGTLKKTFDKFCLENHGNFLKNHFGLHVTNHGPSYLYFDGINKEKPNEISCYFYLWGIVSKDKIEKLDWDGSALSTHQENIFDHMGISPTAYIDANNYNDILYFVISDKKQFLDYFKHLVEQTSKHTMLEIDTKLEENNKQLILKFILRHRYGRFNFQKIIHSKPLSSQLFELLEMSTKQAVDSIEKAIEKVLK